MNNRISVPTIDGIQFVNLQPSDISPLMSKCDIKVLYVGQNRNRSCISKESATEMSKTLRGCPVVGWYREEQKDFGDHGDQLIIDGNGARFNVLTKPYGFVAPDAKVWFQFFEDKDEFGNTCVREYLCVEAFLWTSQFPEAQQAIDNHNPHSMELDEETLKGHWATDSNSGLEFFIINDAIFSKLCILGEEVEPCFEGSSILPPDISSSFSKDDFVKDLLNMAKELKFALSNKNSEGGLSTMEDNKAPEMENNIQPVENSFSEQGENSELNAAENENNTAEEFAKKEEEKEQPDEKKDDQASDDKKEESSDDDKKPASDEEEKKEEPKSKSSLEEVTAENESLKANLEELQNKFASLEEENKKLLDFKREVEDKQKDELIASFYMLSDEDKKDVVENKANYSLDDIESKLSVICVRKKVNFTTDDNTASENNAAAPTIFNLDAHQADNTPAWLKAVDNIANRND